MTDQDEYLQLRAAALDAIVATLREQVGVDRCTLRLEVEGEYFPVVHESRTPGTGSLIGDRKVSLQGQPVVEAILGGAEQVVQPDCASASDDPAFQAMLGHYGGLAAQIVTPVREGPTLLAIISLHHLGSPRGWSERELALPRAGADLVRRLVAEETTA
ncbi:MAG TPA: GAF domain-containing protein [Solirubrobacteraceae bacterium]|nr:GAF domain-containing protein [Solirubrobacteraceae bacterium]